MEIDYSTFNRVLTRAEEVANEPDVKPSVKRVYTERLHTLAMEFRSAHDGLATAETSAAREGAEGRAALKAIDAPYRSARAVAVSHIPNLHLPTTLKQQPTDTDKMNAVRGLLRELDEREESEPWAAELLAEDFGRLAPDAIREVEEWIQSSKDLQRARDTRATASATAYARFLAFKDVVRQSYGSKSRQYKRIHVRAGATEPDPEPTE